MASERGSNRRVAEAQQRIHAAAELIVQRFGIEVEPLPVYRRDPHREAAEQAEWMADVLGRLAEFGEGGVIDLINPNASADEGEDVTAFPTEAEMTVTNDEGAGGNELAQEAALDPKEFRRSQLEEMAVEAGMDADVAKAARNKTELAEFIGSQVESIAQPVEEVD